MNISRNSFKIVKFITKNVLKSVLLSVIAPVKISMMPSAPPTTELPPPAAHQRPKISFSIDSIVSGGVSPNEKKKDSESEEEESKVLSQRSQLESKELKFGNMGKLELLNQFRSMHHPLSSFHHHLQQQLHFNREGGNVASPLPLGGHHHLRYNFHVPPTPKTQSEKEEEQSVVNNRVSSSPRRSPSVHSSRSPSPAERKSPQSQSPRCSSPEESRSSPASINREGGGGMPHGLNSIHLPPTPGQLGPGPLQPFPGFPPMGAPGFPGVPGGHPHHPGIPWGAPPNPPHHSVAHPLYPWILARQARLFPPRFGPGAELPAFLFQPFRKPKRIRTAFSPSQLLRLEHAFEKNHYVVGTERKQLAKSLSLSETQVKVWFQNRRTKHKRTEQEEGPGEKPNNSDISLCGSNLSSSATSADSSTRHFSEEMSEDEEEICMDDEYSADEEEMLHSNYHHHHPNNSKQGV